MEVTPEALARFFEVMSPLLDERQRRFLLGACAEMLGRSGQARVTEASGASRSTVIAGMKEVKTGVAPSARVWRLRRGCGRLVPDRSGWLTPSRG